MRDEDDLETARNPDGENRAALMNLGFALRNVVQNLRISGVAKAKAMPQPVVVASGSTSFPAAVQQPAPTTTPEPTPVLEADRLQNEMDDLMNDLGLDSDDGDDDDDDDDLDLR
eukprot:CAMPEP_0197238662 /NCGR_PEP_ID=MMETSP1429-20130617/5185_1 /TAXON_ID=49237 /ORGANISM="Chaetoceros  sp., Strain UNC1202" /LENGTH=113 /DNA_ID=CAMNT_0042697885 /DNA_START=273 /DNA_END=614 /DNA_ORIENTATION=-